MVTVKVKNNKGKELLMIGLLATKYHRRMKLAILI